MNTLQKSLTIAFLAVSIFISGLTVDFVGAQNTAVIKATSRRPKDLLQSRYLRFGRLTSEDGLSNVQVRGITQDKYGFLWFGTANGLNRYDGSSIKVYRNDPDDPHSLSHNVVRALFTDRSGVFWVSTWGGGLNQYDLEKKSFIRYKYNPDDPHSLSNNSVQAIYEDRAGVIWVGTQGGLNKLNRESKQFKRYTHNPNDPHSLSNNIVSSIFEDRVGFLWVGTGAVSIGSIRKLIGLFTTDTIPMTPPVSFTMRLLQSVRIARATYGLARPMDSVILIPIEPSLPVISMILPIPAR